MSLRIRLVVLIVALVALVAVVLSALHLDSFVNSLSEDAIERSQLATRQVYNFVIDHINQHSDEYDTPAGLEEAKALWREIVASDRDIGIMLERLTTLSPAIVEINIAGPADQILASNDPSRVGRSVAPLQSFEEWRNARLYRRLRDLVTRPQDYQVTLALGIPDQSQPVFTIQVVVSSVLLRSQLQPQIQRLAEVSGGALFISLVIMVFATNRILRPLKRIEETIDRIVQGSYSGNITVSRQPMAKEFAAVESKLDLLGQQFRGAREDATELKHNLDQVLERMASQLDVATRLAAISRITGGVAHEIKNPLNAIALRLDLLRARLGAPEEELAPELDILSQEVRRLDRVVKTLLDFSRPVQVSLRELDLVALAREVTDLMIPQARLASISLRFEAPKEHAYIRGDADLLKQAVLNLVTNGIEAMKNGGELLVSVARASEAVTLEVSDEGVGIPPELRDKVFQLYFTTKPKGSGIGLALIYRAVQLHNGTIDFTSENGRGTTFRLQFPGSVRHA